MKKMKKEGFTLIELLAVIVILGVLLAIAIPSVSKYIATSKKSTYVVNAQEYVDAVKNEAFIGDSAEDIKFPVNPETATVVSFEKLREFLEKGGKKSSYGSEYNDTQCFVAIVNVGSAESPKYNYYIAAIDNEGYGIGDNTGAKAIEYDSLSKENIVQLGAGNGITKPAVNGTLSVIINGTTKSVTVKNAY